SDPTLSGVLEFAGGLRGTIHGCNFDDEISLFEMDLVGARGRVTISDSGNKISFYELADDARYGGYKSFRLTRELDGGLSDVLLNAVKDTLDALTTRGR